MLVTKPTYKRYMFNYLNNSQYTRYALNYFLGKRNVYSAISFRATGMVGSNN